MTRHRLTNAEARRVFLTRHALGRDPLPEGGGLMDLIDRLGFVQVDSINTVERAHHMILSARMKRYRPRHLAPLLERERALFEHWTHDASVIPTRFFPHWKLRFVRDTERLRSRWRDWHANGFEEKFGEVLEHVRRHGPVTSREVGAEEERTSGGWWEWHPSKTALEYLWRTGALSVCRRVGFQKVYDLTERVIPDAHRAPEHPEPETIDWACNAALDRLGFATSGEIAAFWAKVTPEEAKAWCAANPDLVEIDVEGHDGAPRKVYARPGIAGEARETDDLPGGIRVLSPFDPAIRDRKRTERLFGFHYRIEVFVPEPKRRYGYYVFPLLEGDRLVGRIDMKREEGTLAVRALWPEPGVAMGKGRLARLEAELARVTRFAGCEGVRFADGWLREPLA